MTLEEAAAVLREAGFVATIRQIHPSVYDIHGVLGLERNADGTIKKYEDDFTIALGEKRWFVTFVGPGQWLTTIACAESLDEVTASVISYRAMKYKVAQEPLMDGDDFLRMIWRLQRDGTTFIKIVADNALIVCCSGYAPVLEPDSEFCRNFFTACEQRADRHEMLIQAADSGWLVTSRDEARPYQHHYDTFEAVADHIRNHCANPDDAPPTP